MRSTPPIVILALAVLAGTAVTLAGTAATIVVAVLVALWLGFATLRSEMERGPVVSIGAGVVILLVDLALDSPLGVMPGWAGRVLFVTGAAMLAVEVISVPDHDVVIDSCLLLLAVVTTASVTVVGPSIAAGRPVWAAVGAGAPATATGLGVIALAWWAFGPIDFDSGRPLMVSAGVLLTGADLLVTGVEPAIGSFQSTLWQTMPTSFAVAAGVLAAGGVLSSGPVLAVDLGAPGTITWRPWAVGPAVLAPGVLLFVSSMSGRPARLSGIAVVLVGMLVLFRGHLAAQSVDRIRWIQHAREHRLRAMIETAADVLAVVGADGKIRHISGSVKSSLGREPSELRGIPLESLIRSQDRAALVDAVAEAAGSPEPHQVVLGVDRGDGSRSWYSITVRDRLADPHVAGLLVAMRDVSSSRRSAARDATRARQNEAIAHLGSAALASDTPNGLIGEAIGQLHQVLGLVSTEYYEFDPGKGRLRLNMARGRFESTVGRIQLDTDRSSVVGMVASTGSTLESSRPEADPRFDLDERLHHPEIVALLAVPMRTTGRFGVIVARAGADSPLDPSHTSFVESVVSTLGLALERTESEALIGHRASHDQLTGLVNRAGFLEALGETLEHRSGSRAAVIFIDLDRFKEVNDSLGHEAGDLLLVAVAERVRSVVRPGDLVGRLGGDEFTVLCASIISSEEIVMVAERIRVALEAPFDLTGREAAISASIGVAFSDGDEVSVTEFLGDADAAMYRAKGSGRNQVTVFDDAFQADTDRRENANQMVREAIDSEAVEMSYQPMVGLADRRVVAVEALARLRHPTAGLLQPGDFLERAAEIGSFNELARSAVERVVHQREIWSHTQLGSAMLVATNISARQLNDGTFGTHLDRLIRTLHVDPATIMLEIDTSAVLADLDRCRRELGPLAASGVRLVLERFGVEPFSPRHLQSLPWAVVKLDPELTLSSTDHDPGNELGSLGAIVALAHQVAPVVVATQVETPEQLDRMTEVGCDWAQGFLLGRPVSPDAITSVLGHSRRESGETLDARTSQDAEGPGAAAAPASGVGVVPPGRPDDDGTEAVA